MDTALLANILIVLFVLLLFFAALLIFRATLYGRVPTPVEPVESVPVDAPLVAEHLSAAIRQATVSEGGKTVGNDRVLSRTFDDLREGLERMYPALHSTLQRERIGEQSLLYCWPGRAPELEPVLLCAHLDVVPVDPASEQEWTHRPFSGKIVDGYVWGRGALDDKSTLVAILEAVEALVKAAYQPERTLYLAFGHDEEIGGWQGARCIADWLVERGVRLAAVLDEGSGIMEDILPGLTVPAALVGIAEKGHALLEMRVEGRAGHSSIPPRHTAIGVLSRAIAKLENSPMPVRMGMARLMFEYIGPFLPLGMRLTLANHWLFAGTLRSRMSKQPTTNAAIRTTTAVTMMQGGVKDNILPAQARALVNCRLMPGDAPLDALEHVRKAVDDEAVQVSLVEGSSWEPSPVSPVISPIYENLSQTIRQIFPEAVVAPYLMLAATDSRHYNRIASHVFRFTPYHLDSTLMRSIHGTDERVSIESLGQMVQFYVQLIKSWTTVVGRAG